MAHGVLLALVRGWHIPFEFDLALSVGCRQRHRRSRHMCNQNTQDVGNAGSANKFDVGASVKDMQKSFYQKIATMNQQGVAKQYEEFVAEEESTHRYSENGKFLPLSVWRTQGPSSILSSGRTLASSALAQAAIDSSALVRSTRVTIQHCVSQPRVCSAR